MGLLFCQKNAVQTGRKCHHAQCENVKVSNVWFLIVKYTMYFTLSTVSDSDHTRP